MDASTHAGVTLHRESPLMSGTITTFGAVSEGRNNNFDFLRYFLAALVILSHAFDLMGQREPFVWLTHDQISGGGIAVANFFLLSGFLITKSWMQTPKLSTFLEKRVRRILPGFVAALLFCVFVIGPLSGVALNNYFRNLRTYAFLTMAMGAGVTGLPGVFAHNPLPNNVNGSLWTIRVEFLCYLLVAALGTAKILRRRYAVLGAFLLSLTINVLHVFGRLGAHWPYLIKGIVELTPFFLAGATFYSFRDYIPYRFGLLVASLVIIALCCIAHTGLILVLPFCGAYALFYIGFNSRLKCQRFGKYGDFSYGVYLYAFPVQQLLVEYGGRWLNPLTQFGLALLISSGLAALSWHYIEKPFLSRSSKSFPGRP